MNDHIFKDIITEDAIKEVQRKLYNPTKDIVELHDKSKVAQPKLEELIFMAQKTLSSIKSCEDRSDLDNIKREFDRIACMLNNVIKDFGTIYEEIFALHTAEKLAGTFDKKDWTIDEKIGNGVINNSGISKIKIADKGDKGTYRKTSDDDFKATFSR